MARAIEISRNEFQIACTLYNKSIKEQDKVDVYLDDISIKDGIKIKDDFEDVREQTIQVDKGTRIRNIR